MPVKNRVFLLILFFITAGSIFSFSQVDKSWGSGILMIVCGRVINSDTGEGVPGTKIVIYGKYHTAILSTVTNQNGDFCIIEVPEGNYTICHETILRTCPGDLIIKSIPVEIEVPVGKNIHGLEIVLHKGPAVSGRVVGPDGITPIKGAAVSLDQWFRGRKEEVFTDEDGRYIARGLVEGERMISAKKGGYAIESAIVNLQAGKMVENVNFILGWGKISVKGKITAANTNQGLKNAYISFIYTLIGPKLSDGSDETDEDGNYSLIGLLEPGKFKVTIILEGYESLRTEVELKIGENIVDFKLQPELTEKKTRKSVMESRGASSNTQSCHDCGINEDELEKGQEEACKNLSTNSDYIKCIKDPGTLNCMRNRCQRKNYIIVCTNENCETYPDDSSNNTMSYVKPEFVNMDGNASGRIYVCIDNNKGSDAKQFEKILLHELFHLCDKQGTEVSAYERGFCSEVRNYQMMLCIYNDRYYEKKADEKENDCTRLKKNKTTSYQSYGF